MFAQGGVIEWNKTDREVFFCLNNAGDWRDIHHKEIQQLMYIIIFSYFSTSINATRAWSCHRSLLWRMEIDRYKIYHS